MAKVEFVSPVIEKREHRFILTLIDKPQYLKFLTTVEEGFFVSPEAKELWKIVKSIARDKEKRLDYVSVSAYLEENKDKLKSSLINQWNYIKEYSNLTAEEMIEFEDTILKHGAELKVKENIDSVPVLLASGKNEAVVTRLEEAIEQLQGHLIAGGILDDAKTCMEEYVKYHQELNPDEDGVIGVKTGLPNLDYLTKGLKPGELIIIGAQSSVGKSALMANMIDHITKTDAVIFFSLEMNRPEFINRLISISSGLELDKINKKAYERNEAEKKRFNDAIEDYNSRRKFYAPKYNSANINFIQTEIKKTLLKYPDIKVVFIDYLQYIQGNKSYQNNTHQVISEISKKLKSIARDLNIAVVALSQLNREVVKQGKPTIFNLKESGSIEQDADIVLLLYKTTKAMTPPRNPDIWTMYINIEVAKNRNGRTGALQCEFYPAYTKFTDVCLLNDGVPVTRGTTEPPQWLMDEKKAEDIRPTKFVGNEEDFQSSEVDSIPF